MGKKMAKKKGTLPIEFLKKTLIISGTANVILLAFVCYGFFKEVTPTPYCVLRPADPFEQQLPLATDYTNSEVLNYFKKLTMEQLIVKLGSKQLIENGYTQRDLALGTLVSFHYFDLPRALLGRAQPQQQRKISFSQDSKSPLNEIIVYPGIPDADYDVIIQYAKSEQWPLTSKGLFLNLCKQTVSMSSLADAFFLTSEFLAVEMLFNRAEIYVEKNELLKMLCQGDWSMLTAFVETQRSTQDLSDARRQRFLLDYIHKKSKTAAALILKTDGVFAAKKLVDTQVLEILSLLDTKTDEAEAFALSVLTAPRGDKVWQMAAARLYEYANEAKPEKWQHELVLHRFAPNIKELFPQQVAEQVNAKQLAQKIVVSSPKIIENPKILSTDKSLNTKSVKTSIVDLKKTGKIGVEKNTTQKNKGNLYVVQEGDSLWKISRSYKVDIKILMAHNQLANDFLKPGTILRIP